MPVRSPTWASRLWTQRIYRQIDEQLSHEPSHETRNRERLRPNKVAEYELRITKFRVFYDIDENKKVVKIEAIGHKEGNGLFIRGKVKISTKAKTIKSLLKKAQRGGLILRSPEGREFILAEVDFNREIELTRQNKALMKFLDARG